MQALYGPNGICDLFPNTGHKTASASQRVLPDTWRSRKLMAPVNGTQTAKNCTDPGKKSIPPTPCLKAFGLEMLCLWTLQPELRKVV